MTIKYIDPGSVSGGSGTQANPYSISDFVTYFNALSGDQSGNSYLLKTGSFARLSAMLVAKAWNFTLGYYGTGAKPIIAATAIKTGTWTLYSGNIWYITHSTLDSFFYGGQSSNGVASSAIGTRLVPVFGASIAAAQTNGLNTAYTAWFDSANSVGNGVAMYVNLGGINPNTVQLEYTNTQYAINFDSSQGFTGASVTLDHLRFTGAWDAPLRFLFANDQVGLTLTGLEIDQGGAMRPSGTFNVRGNMQIVGSAGKGHYLTGLVIDDYNSTRSLFDPLSLLYCNGAWVHNVTIDDVSGPLGLWNDIINSNFSEIRISNVQPIPNYDSFSGSQTVHYGIYSPNSGQGANGDCYNNRFTGGEINNTLKSAIHIKCGTGWVFENFTVNPGSQQTATFGGNGDSAAVVFRTQGSGVNDPVEATFSNNLVVVYTVSASRYALYAGATATHNVHGDKNRYVATGSNPPHWNVNGADVTVFATYQANAVTAGWTLDANSTYSGTGGASGFINNGTLETNPSSPLNTVANSNAYLSGYNTTPKSAEDGYTDSAQVRSATNIRNAVTTPPSAVTATTVADASSTWNGTYHVQVTYITRNGKTLVSADSTVAVVSGVSGPQISNINAPAAQTDAIAYNVYIGTAANNVTKQNAVPIAIGTGWNTGGTVHAPVSGRTPPTAAPPTGSGEDAGGRPFEQNNLPTGGRQNVGYCAPSRQLRASGSW